VRLFIFDDRTADAWLPFSLSRPCAELLYGTLLLRQRLERFAGTGASGLITRPWLGSFSEPGAPPVLSPEEVPESADRLLLSSRTVPAPDARFERPDGPATLEMDGEIVGAYLPAGVEAPGAAWLAEPAPLRGGALVVDGHVLRHGWDLVVGSADRTAEDLGAGLSGGGRLSECGPGERLGDSALYVAPDVRIEPGVLFDLRSGPICLDRGVEVRAGSRLQGPIYAGPGCRLLGGPIAGLTAGPGCYLRGEIEESVILGYANKAHDGFLGHAYIGRWVNLGALTANSDLKNTYGTVRIAGPIEEADTGLLKFGCLIGDHVKTAIGTLIPTGAVLGCGAVLLAKAPEKWVPAFTWGQPESIHRLEGFLRTAGIAAERRDMPFGEAERTWLSEVWEHATAGRL
jgi:UDP-N-acetylglucosamine diphosphorylase/glucosamine-1-phosphate N-acetyltransferase